MKCFVLLTLILFLSVFRIVTSVNEDAKAKVEQFKNENFELRNDGSGSYSYSFKTSNGIEREEVGSIAKPLHGDDGELSVRGSYSYLDPDGVLYTVHYVADSNGFQPQGGHINVPPAVPSAESRKPNIGASIKDTDVTNKFIVDELPREDQVYHFPSAALASLTGANIG